MVGPFVFDGHLKLVFINISARRNIESLLEGMCLETLCPVHFENDGRTPHFNLKVETHFILRFPGRGGPQGWPPGSPDRNALYRVTKIFHHILSTHKAQSIRDTENWFDLLERENH
jgi:hypothetical protein